MPPTIAKPFRRRPTTAIALFAAFWLAAISIVIGRINDYSNTPSRAGAPPAQWPAASAIPLAKTGPTLVMFAHPRCPCTQATMGELALLMARCQGHLTAHVMFVRPHGLAVGWEKTDLWAAAAAIPGVTAEVDPDGVEAQRFHIQTSGDTLVYDSDGRLQFHGGITLSRGHAGDNPGRSGIMALLNQQAFGLTTTPVFGCSLLGDSGAKGSK